MLLLLAFLGCGDELYATCEVADDCDVPDGTEAACLPKSDEGYCTWTCAADADCDDDDDETDLVCASFEDEEGAWCFPPCSGEHESCPSGFTCRSTGGGSENEKVCFPSE